MPRHRDCQLIHLRADVLVSAQSVTALQHLAGRAATAAPPAVGANDEYFRIMSDWADEHAFPRKWLESDSADLNLFPGEGRGPVAMMFERINPVRQFVEPGPRPSPGNTSASKRSWINLYP